MTSWHDSAITCVGGLGGSRSPTFVLDVQGGSSQPGAAIIINTASLGNGQFWNSDQFPAPHYKGAYTVYNHAGGSAWGFLNVPDLPAGRGRGAQLFQQGLQETDNFVKDTFLWDVVSAGSDSHGTHYKIRNRHSGLLLTRQGNSLHAGALVIQDTDHGGVNQLWYMGVVR